MEIFIVERQRKNVDVDNASRKVCVCVKMLWNEKREEKKPLIELKNEFRSLEMCFKACVNYNIFLHIQLSTSDSDQNIKKDKWLSALLLLFGVSLSMTLIS